jgi:hypothetical protein
MSWHTARLSRYWDGVAPGGEDGGRQHESVPASVRGRDSSEREGVWDTVVVDEAHNARRTTNLYGLLEALRPHTQTYYLMTATPGTTATTSLTSSEHVVLSTTFSATKGQKQPSLTSTHNKRWTVNTKQESIRLYQRQKKSTCD